MLVLHAYPPALQGADTDREAAILALVRVLRARVVSFLSEHQVEGVGRHVPVNTQSGHAVLVVRNATKLRVVETFLSLPLAAALLAAVAATLAGL